MKMTLMPQSSKKIFIYTKIPNKAIVWHVDYKKVKIKNAILPLLLSTDKTSTGVANESNYPIEFTGFLFF